jgi:glyoxylate/hydroxypyruvate reductase A
MTTVLYAGRPDQREAYLRHLRAAFAEEGVEARLVPDPSEAAPEEVDYMVFTTSGPVRDFSPYTGLRAILSLWAGVDGILPLGPPRDVPLVRMIEPGLTLGMIDYVVGHTLRHHLDIDRYIGAQPIAEWEAEFPPLAQDRAVGVLGLGALGRPVAERLAANGFRTLGWARSPREIAGVECHSGEAGLDVVLARSEILCLLLPHTPATERIVGARALALMPRGACLINAGRGPLIDHDALLAALERGHIRHATMDVFDEEPLPEGHPYWRHPRVTVTPHIASVTRPDTASRAIAANIARDLRGEGLEGVVDRESGY